MHLVFFLLRFTPSESRDLIDPLARPASGLHPWLAREAALIGGQSSHRQLTDRVFVPPSAWRKARIADGGKGGPQVFTVTHPFHPLRGQSFDLLAVRNNWGGDRVSYLGTEGRLRTLPLEWTDVHTPDLAVTVGAGRALFRADLLRQLRRLVDEQMARKEATPC